MYISKHVKSTHTVAAVNERRSVFFEVTQTFVQEQIDQLIFTRFLFAVRRHRRFTVNTVYKQTRAKTMTIEQKRGKQKSAGRAAKILFSRLL